MKDKTHLAAEIVEQTEEIINRHPGLARDLIETPVKTIDYSDPKVNKQELKDYKESLSTMIEHSEATSIGDRGENPTHPRPDADRVLDDTILQFDLNNEIENIKQEGNWLAGTQSGKTLLKSDEVRVVLVAMHGGNEIKMHRSNGPVTLQVLEGNIQLYTTQNCVSIKAGQFTALHKKIQHKVVATEQSIFLLTLLNIPGEPKEPDEKDKEIVEQSENINFPDFPTYPPKDDIYKEPKEVQPVP